MRSINILAVLIVLSFSAMPAASQDHSASNHRGEAVMGFDQDRTMHHFRLFTDGGAIDVVVRYRANTNDRDAIRSHLPHIATIFAAGEFDAPMLVHDSKNVPGTAVMASRTDRIHYNYVEIPNGGRVNIVTSDRETLEAVHQFLKFQIQAHKTGDSTDIRTR